MKFHLAQQSVKKEAQATGSNKCTNTFHRLLFNHFNFPQQKAKAQNEIPESNSIGHNVLIHCRVFNQDNIRNEESEIEGKRSHSAVTASEINQYNVNVKNVEVEIESAGSTTTVTLKSPEFCITVRTAGEQVENADSPSIFLSVNTDEFKQTHTIPVGKNKKITIILRRTESRTE